ncbi:MAG: hypothetical protein OEO77_07570 [Acidimicrobiia bacterium]|nr:hypothetical protein [Acidimicrobiia bacterium]
MPRKLVPFIVALLLVPAVSATATPPIDVEFEVTTYFGMPSSGTFTASGEAVDDGLMCPEGTKVDLRPEKFAGNSGIGVINLQAYVEFTCSAGGGFDSDDSFVLKLQVHVTASGVLVSNWTVKGGTGAFADLHGSGRGLGSFLTPPPPGVDDVYTGKLH